MVNAGTNVDSDIELETGKYTNHKVVETVAYVSQRPHNFDQGSNASFNVSYRH